MTRAIEMEGNTVEEAVEAALSELGADRDSVEVEVLEEGNKGFFGRLNSSRAKVRVSLNKDGLDNIVVLIRQIMDKLGVKGDIETREVENSVRIDISGPDSGLLIGKRGETLSAIQAILNIAARKNSISKKLEVDIEDYRSRRADSIKEMAKRAAEKALRTKRPVLLKPMNSYERRMVHVALQGNERVFTISEGEEPNRQVRIAPKQ